jgi:predicted O-methyltransferase YrrM
VNLESATGTHIFVTCKNGLTFDGLLLSTINKDGLTGILVQPHATELCIWCPLKAISLWSPFLRGQQMQYLAEDFSDKASPNQILWAVSKAYEHLGNILEVISGESVASLAYSSAAAVDQMNEEALCTLAGPFNGQKIRKELFWGLIRDLDISAVVETGTYRGTTTEHIAQKFSGPIYTCEHNRRFFEYARTRLSSYNNVHIERMDSRKYLQQLVAAGSLSGANVLFYLDAHWGSDLPLSGELEAILTASTTGAIIIDDFEVPFDPNYGFDNYGPEKILCLDLLRPFREQIPVAFFPRDPASAETGKRRGAVVIPLSPSALKVLSNTRALRATSL